MLKQNNKYKIEYILCNRHTVNLENRVIIVIVIITKTETIKNKQTKC